MHLPISKWLLAYLGVASVAFALSGGKGLFPVAPYHPTALFAFEKGEWLPILMATRDGRAIVNNGSKTRTLPDAPRIRFLRAKDFGPGFIDLKNPTDGEREVGWGGSYLKVIATADRSYTNCMAAAVTFNPAEKRVVTAATSIAIRPIADLKAGKPTEVVLRFPTVALAGVQMVILIFSNGQEIRTSHSDTVGLLFHRLEVQNHADVIRAYHAKYGISAHPAEPALRFPPVFPADVAVADLPAAVHVALTVNRDGLVENLELKEDLPRPAALAVMRAVGGWLYLPKLEDGYDIEDPKYLLVQLHDPASGRIGDSAGQ